MEKILINIICKDISTLHQVNLDGVQLLQNSLEIKNDKVYIKAIIDEGLKTELLDVCEIEIIGDSKAVEEEVASYQDDA